MNFNTNSMKTKNNANNFCSFSKKQKNSNQINCTIYTVIMMCKC